MIRRLALHPKRGGVVQWQTNYKTGEYVVTVAGVPIVACTTKQERDDEMASLRREVTAAHATPARRSTPEQDAAHIFG